MLRGACAALLLTPTFAGAVEPASTGQSGLIHMPDGRVGDDGTLRMGISSMSPYSALWASIVIIPRIEFSARYTRVADTEGFEGTPGFGEDFGSYKDKAFDVKIRLFDETDVLPSLSVGLQDFHGTALFRGQYLAASKLFETARYGRFDVTAGIGRNRFDGAFGGVRWRLPIEQDIRVLAEWDAYDYDDDFYVRRSGLPPRREGGLTLGAEYRFGWFTAQVAHQDSRFGATLSMSIPLQQRTFIPKSDEPPPLPVTVAERPDLDDWVQRPDSLEALYRALAAEGFSQPRLLVADDGLHVSLAHNRMSTIGRAAGRGARLVALHAPADSRTLDLTLVSGPFPLVTYHFSDLALLRDFFEGEATPAMLQSTLSASYTDTEAWHALRDQGTPWDDVVPESGEGGPVVLRSRVSWLAPIRIQPTPSTRGTFRFQPIRLSWLFNDPAGAFKYDLFSSVGYSHAFTDQLFASTSLRITLVENVSDAEGGSNSLLPHVRSDVIEYRRESGRVTLQNLFVAHFASPMDRVFTAVSAGYFEDMYAGIGGEVLYLPERGDWAADFAAYGVRQREFDGGFGFLDYQTVTAIASLHYRLPRQGLTLTARAGRFLARDEGVRFEVKRRFLSGFEFGAWYTVTNGDDITSPGSPDNPYHDKGVFLRFALGPFLSHDSAAAVNFRMQPWARDVGQMVYAPGNLYDNLERRLLLNLEEHGVWSDFGY